MCYCIIILPPFLTLCNFGKLAEKNYKTFRISSRKFHEYGVFRASLYS